VSCSTEEDWKKLKRLLQFLNASIDDFLTIGADNLTNMDTWIDASYAVHADMKSHTGGAISLGRGAVMSKSSKQKLNTKSSTAAELVGASDYVPNSLWAARFLEHQGYPLKNNILHQDNQSAMKMERNGRSSCGQKSRHIDIRYFFIKDRIDRGEIDVVYCPTEMMVADFFTKPLQGALFKKLRAVIMGDIDVATFLRMSSESKERVEKETSKVPIVSYGQTKNRQTVKPTTTKKASWKTSYADAVTMRSE
jgi:hypothetical protein